MTAKNPRYDGVNVFVFDLAKLRPGDLILAKNAEAESFKGRVRSDAIVKATGGNFSHALLCTKPPVLIEAIGEGVSNISALISFVHDLKNVRVLRYRDEEVARKAGSVALGFLGQGYSVRDAIRSVLPGDTATQPAGDRTFCSALVATAFQAAGALEFQNISPMKITPATLENMGGFADVTVELFTEVLAPPNVEAMSALDGVRVLSPMAEQAPLFNSYHAKLSPLIEEIITRHATMLNRKPITFLKCLGFLINGFRVCAELPPGVEKDAVLKDLTSIDAVALELISEGKIRAMLKDANLVEAESTTHTLSESFKLKPDIDVKNLRGIVATTKQQISTRSGILESPLTPAGYSSAWDEWLAINREVIESMKRRLTALEEVLERLESYAK